MKVVLSDLGSRTNDSRVVWEGLPEEIAETNTPRYAREPSYAGIRDGKYSIVVEVHIGGAAACAETPGYGLSDGQIQ